MVSLVGLYTLALFFFACAPALSSDTPAESPVPSPDTTAVSENPSTQHDTASPSSSSPRNSNTSMQSLQTAEMRMISGKEGITIDTQTYDRTIEKKQILGDDQNNDDNLNNVTFAPVELDDIEIGQFEVTIETDNSLGGGPQAGRIESEIPSLKGSFTVGVVLPGGRKSLGSFGMGLQYAGGGQVVVTRD